MLWVKQLFFPTQHQEVSSNFTNFSYILCVKKAAPIVDGVFLSNKSRTHLITTLVLPTATLTRKNNKYKINIKANGVELVGWIFANI